MSHYAVLVVVPAKEIGENKLTDLFVDDYLSGVMAPYDENVDVKPYVRITRDGLKDKLMARMKEYKKILDEKDETYRLDKVEEKYEAMIDKEEKGKLSTDYLIKAWGEETYWHENFNKAGEPLSTYNPDSKWDWYCVGGRWKDMLLRKDGRDVDYGIVRDLDIVGMMREAREEAGEHWDRLQDEKSEARIFRPKPTESREEWMDKRGVFATFAVLDNDGWHEHAKMGWWAITYDENETENEWHSKYYERFLKNLSPDDALIVVDCHI